MYFLALAADYDGTLAEHGVVADSTMEALRRLKETGRKLILVTGRELPDLKRVFAQTSIFDRIVAENGALIHTPATGQDEVVAPAPEPEFVKRLVKLGIEPLSVGRSIVATWEPHQTVVLEVIKELGLELEVIFNKGAVMVLPTGVNKATGLAAALAELGFSPHNVVAVGDAQNDHAFLRACGCSVAVANALPAVKDTADLVVEGSRGAGVEELIDLIIEHDQDLGVSPRNRIAVGESDAEAAELRPRDVALIAGNSGFGKSTLATALTERFAEKGFQFCIFDPEGDYDDLEDAVAVGDGATAPSSEQVLKLLAEPRTNVVVNTLGLNLAERPEFFATLYPELSSLRARTGRPHWLIVDEAHHLMPATRDGVSLGMTSNAAGTILITVHPDTISSDVLRLVTVVIGIGPQAAEVVETYCRQTGRDAPAADIPSAAKEEVVFWRTDADAPPRLITAAAPRQSHKRHTRKYAEGTLDERRSFYFRGPDGALNLRAHNLVMFVQMAEGVDAGTWEFHRGSGDYSRWFQHEIGDDELADVAAAIEVDSALSADESRARIVAAVRERYTAPVSAGAAA